MLYNMIKCFLSFIVTIEGNVYSEAYLGKLLSLAGKLYFAQIDIADIMAAEVYDVSSVRTLSEGITGYEAKTTSLYGVVTGLSEGNLYIDIDTDSHNVISLTGEEDAPREYMLATGMLSSAYEGIVWEEITKYEGVSTMSLLVKAQEENIEILTLSKSNLDTEIEKLNTDETTKQTVINAVNSGMNVIISASEVTIEDWSGIGYIVLNPKTGAGSYLITGGLNGGSSPIVVGLSFGVNMTCCVIDLVQTISSLCDAIKTMSCSLTLAGGIAGAVTAALSLTFMVMTLNNATSTLITFLEYLNGDLESGKELVGEAAWNIVLTIGLRIGGLGAKKALQGILKKDLFRTIGSECTERLLKEFGDVKDLSKYVKRILKMGLDSGVIIEVSEKFGREGLEWIISKQGKGLTNDLVRKMLKADSLDVFTDSVLHAIKNSAEHADDIIEQIVLHGEDAARVIVQYGDDALEALMHYGEDALNALVKYGQDAVEIFVVYGDDAAKYIKQYGDVATEAFIQYGDDALEVLTDYGDDAVEGFKNGKTPDEIRAGIESGINSYVDFSKVASDIGMRSDLTDAQKVSELQKLFKNSNYKTDINVPSDIQYVKGFDASGNVIYDWPPKLGFDENSIKSISRTDGLPDTWDRYGYMGGSNFADVPSTGKYSYSERAIPYVENEAAYHTGTFNNATYFDKIDAIKNGDIETLNNILSSEGIDIVDSSYFENLRIAYKDFIEDTVDVVGDSIDATYGLKGKAASWGDMSGGAGQYVTPLNGTTMSRLGIIN